MKILHTSDWHLGRSLYGRKRYEEFAALLDWMAETVRREEIDVLLVAGDVFDNGAPSTRAQELYYRFLGRMAGSPCRHVVVVAGNHDSPSFLDAPGELLEALGVHVTGGAASAPEDEVLVLRDGQGAPELVVCAVPYLRDRDIREAQAGESAEDKERKLVEGIRAHYAAVAAAAQQRRAELEGGEGIPIVATGHLFTAGGQVAEGDGVRELYVGSLAHVAAETFPPCFDYVALGHLHAPQEVGGSETLRYSGSPLPMGFGEAHRRKSVCRVEFHGRTASVQRIDVPVWQELASVRGGWDEISRRIRELAEAGSRAWLEVVYEGEELVGDLRDRLEAAIDGTSLEILRITNTRVIDRVLEQAYEDEALADLDEDDVFARCLDAHAVPEGQRPELLRAYREALASLREDGLAEG